MNGMVENELSIDFPLINLSSDQWIEDDLMLFVLYDEYIYNDSSLLFTQFFKDQYYCDCQGQVFKLIAKKKPDEWWRNAFRFLPNVFRVTLVFEATAKTVSVDELANHVRRKIAPFKFDDFKDKWLEVLNTATTHAEILLWEY